MTRRKKTWIAAVVLAAAAALAVLVVTTSGPPPPSPTPPGTFSFAALGDAPYYPWEDLRFPLVLRDLAAHDLAFVVHVGDIFWRPCSDERYRRSLDWFNGLPCPVIYTPGDNEWADCWEATTGGYVPRERLARIRQIFFHDPGRSLGGRPIALASQGSREGFEEFVENVRWSHQGIVFATVHVVGSANGLERRPDRDGVEEVRRRTAADADWLRETFAEARSTNASAVVIAFHADASLEDPPDDPYRQAFEPFLAALEEEVERFSGPVLAVHGDRHDYAVDHPLVRRTTGRRLANFTRLRVPGSPAVGWVRVVVTPGAASPFAFEPRVLPSWKYW